MANFWCAFGDGEVEVIGDVLENTINDRTHPRLLCIDAGGGLFGLYVGT
jgi:hypothetical protein